MGYFIAFGLVYLGYSLVDWGHYVLKHEQVGLWWLMSGMGTPPGGATPGGTSGLRGSLADVVNAPKGTGGTIGVRSALKIEKPLG